MWMETQRLLIRDIIEDDGEPFVNMAADGSLNVCGFDRNCSPWMPEWIAEAKGFAVRDNPNTDYLAYTITLKDKAIVVGSVGCSYYEDFGQIGITYFIGAEYRSKGYAAEAVKAYTEYFFRHYKLRKMIATVRDDNIPSWKAIEKGGFIMTNKVMYKDIYDDKEELYRFYEISNDK